MERTATIKNFQASQLQNAYKTSNFKESKLTNDLDVMHRKSAFNFPYASTSGQEALNYIGKSYGRPPSNIDLHADFNGGFDKSLTSSRKLDDRLVLKQDKTPNLFLP